jgi:hypothetical protein
MRRNCSRRAGRATVGTVIPDFNIGYTYQKTDPRTLTFLELPEVFRVAY